MKVFAIGDLHLPGGDQKPMDVFGAHWANHFERISQDWRDRVGEQDVVLIPGDISWAMQLQDAATDLRAIGALPGRKVLLRGNHDYWWGAITRVRSILPQGMFALQNDALVLEDQVFCGTRGWVCPGDAPLAPDDEKIYRREALRLEMSLKTARRVAPSLPLTVLLHYPPCNERQEPSAFTSLLESYGVQRLVYGHLHGAALRHAIQGTHWGGCQVFQVSCDGLKFSLLALPDA